MEDLKDEPLVGGFRYVYFNTPEDDYPIDLQKRKWNVF